MPGIVSGESLGLFNNQLVGLNGQGSLGQAGAGISVNAATGNLVIRQSDQVLVGLGVDTGVIRTYNSQGRFDDDNGDNFRFVFNQRLTGLTGSVNAAGSTITRVGGDGAETLFTYQASGEYAGLYVSTDGQGAHDTLEYDAVGGEWTRVAGGTQRSETFDWIAGQGKLIARADADGNTTTFAYHANGFVNQIADASGQLIEIVYSGNNATEVRTTSEGVTQSLVTYQYDTSNRLIAATIDLTPDDTTDSKTYATTYTYDGTTNRVASISQSDGTTASFSYDAAGRIASVTDGEGHVTTYDYTDATISTIHGLDDSLLLPANLADGFEAGLADWQGSGDLSTADSGFGESPTEGGSQAVATNATGSVTATELETFLGMTAGALGTVGGGNATEGSALKREFTVQAGTTLSFDFNFLTNEFAPDATYNDFAFVSLQGASGLDIVSLLANTESGFNGSGSAYGQSTDYQQFSHTFSADDTVTLGIGALDMADTQVDSAVLVDNFSLTHDNRYYTVQSGDTWASITLALYGSSDVAGELEAFLGSPALTAGANLTGMPSSLTRTEADYSRPAIEAGITDALGHTTTYRFDAEGKVVEVLQPEIGGSRQSTTYSYDADDNLLSTTDGNGKTTRYEYDARGNRTLEQDALGNTVSRVYSANDELLSETRYLTPDPDGAGAAQPGDPLTSHFAYDAEHHLRFSVDAAGQVVEFRYDAYGNQVSRIAYTDGGYAGTDYSEVALAAWAAGQDLTRIQRVDTAYDFRGQVGAVTRFVATDAAGNGLFDGTQSTTGYFYDQHGRLTNTVAPAGVVTTTDPSDYVTTHVYDGLGRLFVTVDALGHTTYNYYDDAAQAIVTQSANGLLDMTVFDANGRPTAHHQYDDVGYLGSTLYSYDKAGRLLTTIDPEYAQTHSLHNGQGQLIAEIGASGALTRIEYDLAGNAVAATEFANSLNATQIGDLLAAADNGTVTATLDGIVATLASADDRRTLTLHDAANRVTHLVDAAGYTTQYFYDGAGRVTDVIEYATAVDASLVQPELGGDQLTPVTSGDDRRARKFYDAAGRQVGSLDAAGYLGETVYDAAGKATESIHYATAAPAAQRASADLATLRAAIGVNAEDRHAYMQYNGIGQLIASLDTEGYLTEYRYDLNGNRTEVTRYANTAGAYSAGAALTSLRPAVDANDRVTVNAWTELDQLASVTSKAGAGVVTTTEYTYDEMGRVVRTDSAAGTSELRSARARYDMQGRLVGELSAIGASQLDALINPTAAEIDAIWAQYGVAHAYDKVGRRTATTDQNGNTTLFYYDVSGRLRFRVNALGEVAETRYNAFDEAVETIAYTQRIDTTDLAGGAITTLLTSRVALAADLASDARSQVVYDLRGMISAIADGEGNLSGRAYNAFGDLTAISRQNQTGTIIDLFAYEQRGLRIANLLDSAGLARWSTTGYDAFGREISRTDARGIERRIDYLRNDGGGRRIVVTQGAGGPDARQRTTVYDAFDRMLQEIDANGNTTIYQYDDAARRLTVTSPEGVQSVTETNRHGETVKLIDTELNETVYQYDANGNLTGVTDAANQVTTRGYDDANRLIETTDARGTRVEYSYDAVNRELSRTVDPGGLGSVTSQVFDGQGRTVISVDANGIATVSEYDRNGRVTATVVDPTTYPSGLTRPAGFGAALNLRTEIAYDAAGNRVSVTEAAGTAAARVTEYHYDALDRRVAMVSDAQGALPLRTEHAYDVNGNVVRTTEAAGTPVARVTRHVYDDLNRAIFRIDTNGYVGETVYDANGNAVETIAYATPVATAGLDDTSTEAGVRALIVTAAADRNRHSVYDGDDRIQYAIDAAGFVTDYRYDSRGLLQAKLAYAEAIALPATIDAGTIASLLPANPTPADARSETYQYDALGRLTVVTDALGTQTKTDYDAVGNAIRTTEALGLPEARVTERAHDARGLVIEETRAYGTAAANTTRYVYDDLGQRVGETDARGVALAESDAAWAAAERERLGYDAVAANLTVAQRDALFALYSRSFAYDALGRLVGETDALGNTTSMAYDAFGNKVRVTDPSGNSGYYYYDSRDRLVYSLDPEGYLQQNAYDAFGNVTDSWTYANAIGAVFDESSAPASVAAAVVPDAARDRHLHHDYLAGRDLVAATTHSHVNRDGIAEPYTESFGYDAFGNRTAHTDRGGYITDYEFDARDRLVRVISPEVTVTDGETGAVSNQRLVTEYGYDAFGNRTQVREAAGLAAERMTTTYYDALDRPVLIEHPALTVFDPATGASASATPQTQKIYDAIGNLVEEIDAGGGHTFNYYDAANRLVASVNADGALSEFEYDAAGNVVRDRTYDERVIGVSGTVAPLPVNLADYRENTHRYDANNLRVETRSQAEVHFSHQNLVQNGIGYFEAEATTQYAYDANGSLVEQTDPRGFRTFSFYDDRGNLILQVDPAGYVTAQDHDHEGRVVRVARYAQGLSALTLAGLNAASNAAALRAEVLDDSAVADANRVTEFDYDALGREVARRDLAVNYASVDAVGNIVELTGDLVSETGYDALDRTSFVVQANGERSDYTYDSLGRQVQQQGASFDAFGNFDNDVLTKVATRATTSLGYDAHGNLVQQTRHALAGADDQVTRSVHNAAGFVVATIDAAGHRIDFDLDAAGRILRQRESLTDVDGITRAIHTLIGYDALGREISRRQVEAPGTLDEKAYTSSEFRYNAHGDVEAEGRNGQFQVEYLYDKLGRILKSNKDNGTPRIYVYDLGGNSVIEAHALAFDLGYVTSAAQVASLDPDEVQLTISVYGSRNLLTDRFEPPMDYFGLTTYMTEEELTEIIPGISESNTGPVEVVGGLTRESVPLDVPVVTVVDQFDPPAENTLETALDAAAELGLPLGTFDIDVTVPGEYIDDPATVTAATVERSQQGDLSLLERVTYTRQDGSVDYLTRTIEVFDSTAVEIQPFGLSGTSPGTFVFSPADSVSVSLSPNYSTRQSGENDPVTYLASVTATIEIPEILGYGDGPTRVQFFSDGSLRYTEDVYGAGTVTTTGSYGRMVSVQHGTGENMYFTSEYQDNPYLVRLWKGGKLIASGSTAGFATPSIVSVGAQNAATTRVDISINGGNWVTLPVTNPQNSVIEHVSANLNVVAGDVYEYRAYDADGNEINRARGVVGVGGSYENASTVTTTQAKIKRITAITSEQLPGETGTEVTVQLAQSETGKLTYSGPPVEGTTVTYLDSAQYTGLTLGVTTATQPDNLLSDEAVVDGSTTTRTVVTEKNIQVETDIHYLVDDPGTSGIDESLFLEEVVTTTKQIETVVTVTDTEALPTIVDDHVFVSTSGSSENVVTTVETETSTVTRLHKVRETHTVSNLSSPYTSYDDNPGGVDSSTGPVYFWGKYKPQSTYWKNAEETVTVPAHSEMRVYVPAVTGSDKQFRARITDGGYNPVFMDKYANPGSYAGVSASSNYYDDRTIRFTVWYDGQVMPALNDRYYRLAEPDHDGTWSTLANIYPFTISNVNPQVDPNTSRIRVNGGVWITGFSKSIVNNQTYLIGFNSALGSGAYEYELFDYAGNLLQWGEGTIDDPASAKLKFVYDESLQREHIVETNSDWSFTRQILESSSSEQTNYTQRLLHTIVSGTPVENVIHNQQEYNAFGEIVAEIDGRGNRTDLRYDTRGNLAQKIAAETDAWSEALSAQWAVNPNKYALDTSERTRPTETFFYDAAGIAIASEDANGNRNSRQLAGGRVEAEYFADGSFKSYAHDRLGNQRLEVDQLGRATTREYDVNGRLVEVERHVGAGANNNLYFSGVGFDRWSNTRRQNQGEGEYTTTTTHYLKVTVPTLLSGSNVRVKIVDAADHNVVFGDHTLRPGSSREYTGYDYAEASYVYIYQGGTLVHEGALTITRNASSTLALPTFLTFTNVDSYVDRFGYDGRGNRLWHDNAHGNRESYYYDAESRVTRHVSAAGRQTLYDYQYLSGLGDGVLGSGAAVGGVQTTVTNANGDTLVDRHTHFGKLVYHEDLGGHQFNYSYNTAGWLYEQTGTTANAQGNVTGNDQHINYYYYANGYLKEVVDTGYERYALFQYDQNGNRVSEYYAEVPFQSGQQQQVPYQMATAEYDELNRVKRVFEADRYDIRYFYDANGNRRRINSQYTDLLRNQQQEQDFYYRYDAMNRFVVTMGEIDASGLISHGNTGYSISYDAAGQRVNAVSELLDGSGNPDYSDERYFYDPIGTLGRVQLRTSPTGTYQDRAERLNNALGQVQFYIEYDGSGNITKYETYVYDDDHKLRRQMDIIDPEARAKTTYSYLADGTLSQVYTRTLEADGSVDSNYSKVWQTYDYASWDGYKETSARVEGDLKAASRWSPGASTTQYDANGHVREFYDHAEDRTIRYVNNHLGQVMKRYQVDLENGIQKDPIIRRFFYLNGVGIGDQGTDEVPSRIDYAQVLANRRDDDDKRLHTDIGNRVSPVTSADFDQNFRPIGPDYPSKTPGTYVVNAGDTLQSIASTVWGDSSLWYLIADANGQSGASDLVAGTRLSIPNVVTNVHNNSETFRPYDPSLTLGDTSATLPEPVIKDDKCGPLGMIIVMAVSAIVSTVFSNPVAGSKILGAVIGGAAGSIAGQLAAMGLGLQDEFSWSRVASEALAAGFAEGVTRQIDIPKKPITQRIVRASVQDAAAQGINVLVGEQDKFDWKRFASSTLTAGFNTNPSGLGLGEVVRTTALNTLINRSIYDRGDDGYQSIESVAISALGAAVSNSMVASIHQAAADRERRLNYVSPSPHRDNQGPGYISPGNPHPNRPQRGGAEILGGQDNSAWGVNIRRQNYTIQRGDNLSQIAKEIYGDANMWPLLGQANGIANPDSIQPGQVLVIPDEGSMTSSELQDDLDEYYSTKSVATDLFAKNYFEDQEIDLSIGGRKNGLAIGGNDFPETIGDQLPVWASENGQDAINIARNALTVANRLGQEGVGLLKKVTAVENVGGINLNLNQGHQSGIWGMSSDFSKRDIGNVFQNPAGSTTVEMLESGRVFRPLGMALDVLSIANDVATAHVRYEGAPEHDMKVAAELTGGVAKISVGAAIIAPFTKLGGVVGSTVAPGIGTGIGMAGGAVVGTVLSITPSGNAAGEWASSWTKVATEALWKKANDPKMQIKEDFYP